MVDKIEIKYQNKLIILDKNNKEFIINGTKKQFQNELFNNLLNIMSLWKNNYLNNKVLDGFTFFIKIYVGKEYEVITIKNNFPSNFQEFLKVLGDL